MAELDLKQKPQVTISSPAGCEREGSSRKAAWLSRTRRNRIAGLTTGGLTICASFLVFLIALGLYLRARPILQLGSFSQLVAGTEWHPMQGKFGFLPFIAGTVWVTSTAMLFSIPASILTAIFLAEFAPRRVRGGIKPLIDLLAGIPSVVFGLWGVLVIVPLIRYRLTPFLARWLRGIPIFADNNASGYGIFAASIVLAVMVFPIIISVTEEVIHAVPQGLREASLALGATRWQTVKHVVLRKAGAGIVAAIGLGFSRALGETMAVMMVVGNIVQLPHSIFDAAYPLTALIANNYGEMMSVPLYDSALMAAALLLLLVVLGFSVVSRLVLLCWVQKV